MFIHSVGRGVGFVGIQADTTEVGVGGYLFTDVFVEGAEDASLAEFGTDIHGLNPQHGAVAPIAPFESGEK